MEKLSDEPVELKQAVPIGTAWGTLGPIATLKPASVFFTESISPKSSLEGYSLPEELNYEALGSTTKCRYYGENLSELIEKKYSEFKGPVK